MTNLPLPTFAKREWCVVKFVLDHHGFWWFLPLYFVTREEAQAARDRIEANGGTASGPFFEQAKERKDT